jgi:peroxiredoxin
MDSAGRAGLWQAFGVAAGVFGLAYVAAASDPLRHWPVVGAGLVGTVLVAGGVATAGVHSWIVWLATASLAWCIPFALIVGAAWTAHRDRRIYASPEIQRWALNARTQYGVALDEMSRLAPLMLVFLRHRGCMFCREAVADIARQRRFIEANGVQVAFVYQEADESEAFFAKHGLDDVPRVADSDRSLYRAFGLGRGSLLAFLGPKLWWRAFRVAVLDRHGVGWISADPFQMPGVFLIFHGETIRSFRHVSAADRPDYVEFCGIAT